MSTGSTADADAPYECVYCGCDVRRHDPVSVTESADPTGEPDARYCNYGCLAAHIEEAELTTGTSCDTVVRNYFRPAIGSGLTRPSEREVCGAMSVTNYARPYEWSPS